MKINVANKVFTHEGGPAVEANPLQRLRRTVLACLLFEDNFYEDGIKAVDRIKELCAQVTCDQVLMLALDASEKYHLRHVPLQMIVEALKHKDNHFGISNAIPRICKRADQMTDLLSLYWRDGKKPIPHQLKKGLCKAFQQFDEYALSKYDRDNPVKLRDVLFMIHAKPRDEAQAELWKRLANRELKTADTWETRLSSGADKKESFQELLESHKMGKLAILRNLRNMKEAGIDKKLVAEELIRNTKEMLPFQYLAAARECKEWEEIVDTAMILACSMKPKLAGQTVVLVDVSSSMASPVSGKSKMMRLDAACGMAILLRECCEDVCIASFSTGMQVVPPRKGMALRDAIINSQVHGGTYLGGALLHLKNCHVKYDRLIVITDEQSHDVIPRMNGERNYILNIAHYKNGVGRQSDFTTISGFSEASIDFIRELENVS